MKILVAPDSFKGSASAREVAQSIGLGIKKVMPNAEVIELPIADGGEGTLETLLDTLHGEIIKKEVVGPLGNKVIARYGIADRLAIIEMADASGLMLVDEKDRDPLLTTTYGTGELIRAAIEAGCNKIVIGIGGSATNDGGVGMAQALGYSFLDEQKKEINYGGGELERIHSMDTTNVMTDLGQVNIVVACDVQNILFGPEGASYIYGKQKGGTPESIERLDKGLEHFSSILERDLKLDVSNVPGSGAAGGFGAGLMAFCNAKLEKGIEMVLDLVDIDKYLIGTDLVITGEGQMDGQSIYGKTPVGLANRASKYNVPAIAIVGSIGKGIEQVYEHNIISVIPIVNGPLSLEEAQDQVKELLVTATERALKLIELNIVNRGEQ